MKNLTLVAALFFWGINANLLRVAHGSTVSLTVSEMPFDGDKVLPRVLPRELLRQGFLMVARDQFGCSTRDHVLGEKENDVIAFDLEIQNVHGESVSFKVLRDSQSLATGRAPYSFGKDNSGFSDIAAAALTTFDQPFREALKKAGLKEKLLPVGKPSDASLKLIDDALASFTIISQYRAARSCHKEIRKSGYSAEILGRISRAYANLSQLSHYFLVDTKNAFAARSLLYATELAEKFPQSSIGIWHQAYSLTMVGLTKDSICQLARIDETRKTPQEPSWLGLVKYSNNFDYKKLQLERVKDSSNQLANFLWFRSVEFCDSQPICLEIGKQALRSNPRSLRILHGMDHNSGISYRHQTTTMPDAMMLLQLRDELPRFAGDETISNIAARHAGLENMTAKIDLINELRNAAKSDVNEPSTAVLGHILEELNVLHVAQRIHFLKYGLGVDSTDFVHVMRPVYENHALLPFFEFLSIPYAETKRRKETLQAIPQLHGNFISGYRLIFTKLPGPWSMADGKTVNDFRAFIWSRASRYEPDYSYKVKNQGTDEWKHRYAEFMEANNPHSPLRIAILITYDWENEKHNAKSWLDSTNRHPAILRAVGEQHYRDGEYDRAAVLFREVLGQAADAKVFQKLAAIQYEQGDRENGFSTAKASLQVEDYGLDHATMNQLVAHTLMSEQNYSEALSWAAAAAESGAGWAIQTHAQCLTLMGNFDDAASVYQELDANYGTDYSYHYWARHQVGTARDALKVRGRYLKKNNVSPEDRSLYGAFHYLFINQPDRAANLSKRFLTEDSEPLILIYAAFMNHEAGRLKERNQLLRRIRDAEFDDQDVFAPIVRLFAASIENQKIEPKLLATNKAETDVADATAFIVGWCYELLGNRELAVQSYKRSARSAIFMNTPLLSCYRLRKLGEAVPNRGMKLNGFKEMVERDKRNK